MGQNVPLTKPAAADTIRGSLPAFEPGGVVSSISVNGDRKLVKPVLQAILLADHVYQDKVSGKMIVAGIFSTLNLIKNIRASDNQPDNQPNAGPHRIDPRDYIRAGSPSCYINLTSVRGTIPLELRYVDLADNSVLMSLNFTIPNNDPLKNVEINAPLPMLPVPHVGSYALELLTDNELVGSHRIIAAEQAVAEEQ
jgi:hypothetical protein